MSAFALRKRLLQQREVAATPTTSVIERTTKATDKSVAGQETQPAARAIEQRPHSNDVEEPKPAAEAAAAAMPSPTATAAKTIEAVPAVAETARRETPVLRSTFRPTEQTLQRIADGDVQLQLTDGERLVVVGSYGLSVRTGVVTLAGAILTASSTTHWVHAPQCHALPVLRCVEDAEIVLAAHPAAAALRQLATLSPLFARLWNEEPAAAVAAAAAAAAATKIAAAPASGETFQILYTSDDGPARTHDLVAPAAWNKLLSEITAACISRRSHSRQTKQQAQVVFVCGPKASGKSTFARLLTNRLLTEKTTTAAKLPPRVAVLDIDPGQPEYGTPGTVSLVLVAESNLAPPLCHPYVADYESGGGVGGNRRIRAHDIAAVSPAADPDHVVACVLDLVAVYARDVRPRHRCPLVVNTPGWIQGTGLELLVTLVTRVTRLWQSRVVYMSQEGPDETVQALRVAAASTAQLDLLPSQPSDAPAARTAAQLRAMQTLSYFHLDLARHGRLAWRMPVVPLAAERPWVVPYSGRTSGILGIRCYDYQPATTLLANAINGTLVSMVAVERMAAFGVQRLEQGPEKDPELDPDDNAEPRRLPPAVVWSPEGLPFIPGDEALDPRHTHALGLALVRGVDTVRRTLHLLTPVAMDEAVDDMLRREELGIVLVAGNHDLPTWAYTEAMHARRVADSKEGEDGESSSDGGESDEADATEQQPVSSMGTASTDMDVPWVEVLYGSQKRAVGSQVWRVRRDLGRNMNRSHGAGG